MGRHWGAWAGKSQIPEGSWEQERSYKLGWSVFVGGRNVTRMGGVIA